jgi:hypothetical protein
VALVLAACGGGDDDDTATDTATDTLATQPPLQTEPPVVVTTLPPVATTGGPTPVSYVTSGASVMVANASRIDGAAGRLTERLSDVGYETVAAGNYSLGQLEVSKIYYDAANTSAKAVADSLKAAFGGGGIEVLELPTPPPVDSGKVNGAGVLVAMGNDIADKSLEELQGITTTTSAPASEESVTGTGADTTTDSTTA